MLFHRRAFLRAMGVLTAAPGLRAAGWNVTQQASTKRKRYEMEIKRVGTQPSAKGPSEWFTGAVRIDPLFQAPDPALVQGASVTFEPGARTAWHTHPLGQTLIVTAGCGWVQRWSRWCRGASCALWWSRIIPSRGTGVQRWEWSAGRISPTGTPQQRQEQYSPSHG